MKKHSHTAHLEGVLATLHLIIYLFACIATGCMNLHKLANRIVIDCPYMEICNSLSQKVTVSLKKGLQEWSDSYEVSLLPGQKLLLPGCLDIVKVNSDTIQAKELMKKVFFSSNNEVRRDLRWRFHKELLSGEKQYILYIVILENGVYCENRRGYLSLLQSFNLGDH